MKSNKLHKVLTYRDDEIEPSTEDEGHRKKVNKSEVKAPLER
jgi:hypothetical protein